jgi:uncharacterized protein involved in outer membrane biogenesis
MAMRWKWVLGTSLAVIVALVVTAFIFLASYDFNKFKPQISDLAKQHTGRELTLGGDIELAISLVPTLVVNDVAFENASWGSRPQMAQVKRAEVQIAVLPLLRGTVHVNRLTVVNPDFLIEVDKSGKSNLEFDVPKGPEAEAAEEPAVDEGAPDFLEVEEVELENAAFTYNDQQSGRTEALAIENLKLKASEPGAPLAIESRFTLNETPFQITGELGRVSTLLSPDKPWPLNLTITAVDSTVSIAGQIANVMETEGIDLKLAAKGPDIGNFEQVIGEPLPVKGPFDVAGHLTAATLEEFKVSDLAIVLGENQVRGDIALRPSSPRPQIDANLQAQELDLRPFIKQEDDGAKSGAETKKSEPKSDKVFSGEPFDLQALHQVDAVVKFRADQILTQQVALDNLTLDVSLKNGHLIIKPLTTNIGGGDLSSNLDLLTEGSHAKLATKISAKKIDLARMLKELDISQDMEGIFDLDITLKGQGKSVAALMAGLNGDVVFTMGEGKMPVEYLDVLGADMTNSLLKIVNPFEEKIDSAQINCAVADFNIRDGLATSDVILIDDPKKALLSAGTLNLKTEALDFGIQTKPKEGIGTQETGKLSVSLSEITRPFKLGGTLASPLLAIDPSRTAETVGKALLGPAGWATLLVSGSGDENPCAAALNTAGEVAAKPAAKSGKVEKKEEGVVDKIKGLFDTPKE